MIGKYSATELQLHPWVSCVKNSIVEQHLNTLQIKFSAQETLRDTLFRPQHPPNYHSSFYPRAWSRWLRIKSHSK